MSEEDPYGNEMYKTRPELLCPPSMKNITGVLTLVILMVAKSFFTQLSLAKVALKRTNLLLNAFHGCYLTLKMLM